MVAQLPPPQRDTAVVRRPVGLWREVRHRGGASFICYCASRWHVLAAGLAAAEAEVGCSRWQDGGGRRGRRPCESPGCGDDDSETEPRWRAVWCVDMDIPSV
jgi:hypothetical protein